MMNPAKTSAILSAVLLCNNILLVSAPQLNAKTKPASESGPGTITLPQPRHHSNTSIEEALLKRRSIRNYKDKPVTLAEVSQLLWAAQGITGPRGFRTAPSAGALYPLEVYVVVGEAGDLPQGIYHYIPHRHEITMIVRGDKRAGLRDAALGQPSVKNAAVVIVISAVYERTTVKYGERGMRYVHMEAGHAAQNVYLQAVSLDLGTVVTGAFHDDEVRKIMKMAEKEQPLYIMPVGRR
jgi:SagB-type dehydrogenase family enzyme